jgi:hypothetical protein
VRRFTRTANPDCLYSQTEKRSKKIIDDATEFYDEAVSLSIDVS